MFRFPAYAVMASLAFFYPASAQEQELEFGPFMLGDRLDCDDVFLGKETHLNARATFENGDFDGIWGTGGVAIVQVENFDGGRLQVNWTPPNRAIVTVWGDTGTAINPSAPDLVGIWGTGGVALEPVDFFGGNGIWGTGGVAVGSPVKVRYEKPSGQVWFIVADLDNAIKTADPGS